MIFVSFRSICEKLLLNEQLLFLPNKTNGKGSGFLCKDEQKTETDDI